MNRPPLVTFDTLTALVIKHDLSEGQGEMVLWMNHMAREHGPIRREQLRRDDKPFLSGEQLRQFYADRHERPS